MLAFIVQQLKYPQEALAKRVEGTVIIKYAIDQHGDVTEAKVLAGVGHGCDEEAVRIVKLLKFKSPKNRGLRVVFHKNIQIHFKLPKTTPAEPADPPSAIQYHYTLGAASQPAERGHLPQQIWEGIYTLNY